MNGLPKVHVQVDDGNRPKRTDARAYPASGAKFFRNLRLDLNRFLRDAFASASIHGAFSLAQPVALIRKALVGIDDGDTL